MAGLTALTVPFAGTVLRIAVAPGDRVAAGAELLVLESMKMEHVVEAPAPGTVVSVGWKNCSSAVRQLPTPSARAASMALQTAG